MKKKGFTLIELLAVIVILAIIALIAMPLVLNTIEKAKEGAAKASAYAYAEEVERYIILSELDPTLPKLQTGVEYKLSKEKNEVAALADPATTYINDLVSIKGDKPTSGYLKLDGEYKIEKMEMIIKSYPVTCENDECKITGSKVEEEEKEESSEEIITGPTQEVATNGETYKAIVYLDPTDLTKTCNASNAVSATGTKSGCMKWYAYAETDNTYTMILDHNISGNVAWNSTGSNSKMQEVINRLNEDIIEWNKELNPTIISAQEIADITGATNALSWNSSLKYAATPVKGTTISWFYLDGNDGADTLWQTQVAKTSGSSKYAWLYDNTYECTNYGCNVEDNNLYPYGTKDNSSTNYIYGYWISTAISSNTDYAWRIRRDGYMRSSLVNGADASGVRPVITISKDILK